MFSLHGFCLYLSGRVPVGVFILLLFFFLHLGVVVDLHTRLGVDVLGADNLTVSLQSLQLEKLGCRQKLNDKKKKHNNSN